MTDEPIVDPSLTAKQDMFCREYLCDLNATQAAIRAGYSEHTAAEIGWENLRKPQIQARLKALMEGRVRRLDITADRILQELAHMAYARMGDYAQIQPDGDVVIDFSAVEEDPDLWAAVQEFVVDEYVEGRGPEARNVKRVKFKLSDKRGALELLGKYLKLFRESVDHRFPDGIPKRHEMSDEELLTVAGGDAAADDPERR